MASTDPMSNFRGKDPVEVVGILKDRLARAHRREQQLLGDPKRAYFDCALDDGGDHVTVYTDEFGVGLDDALALKLAKSGRSPRSVTAQRADGKLLITRIYD